MKFKKIPKVKKKNNFKMHNYRHMFTFLANFVVLDATFSSKYSGHTNTYFIIVEDYFTSSHIF